jgi:hypothetical protein
MFVENNFYDFWISKGNKNNIVLKAIINGSLNSIFQNNEESNLNLTNFIVENSNKNRIFAWTTAGPGHSSTLNIFGSGEKEVEHWLPNYSKTVYEMQIEIAAAVKTNPNAILIFMSDHGPFLIDSYRIPPNYDFSKTDHIKFRDLFGAFMAVRFPDKEKAAKYDKDFNATQDLFPIIFAYLFDSEIPLKYKVQNTELQLGPHKFDKGIFYKDFYESRQ